ncbi:MAG TPA: GDSL-type esterase/lipase family protein [Longimicrobium sp.]|nr:GDSL-type esterase/lipase family protein [Longimicrobium sp.]
MHEEHPRVFISYSWDDEEHKQRVLELAQRLRRDGVDAWLDRFTSFPTEGWPRWMQRQVQAARFVLCVLTPNYGRRFHGDTPPDEGRGANWEGSIITARIYDAGGRNDKFIPVFFRPEDARHAPDPLGGFTRVGVGDDAGYEALYRLLTSQPDTVPEPLGNRRTLSPTPLSEPEVYHHRNLGSLPRLTHFVGREEHLATIAQLLGPDDLTYLILIDGPGGMGKTTLAIRAAELAPEEHFPRIVFASAKTRVLEPRGVRPIRDFLVAGYLDLLNRIALELGHEGLGKLDEKERPQELRRILGEQPTLLVLDNLETLPEGDLERLMELLRHLPRGTKTIATSRRRTGYNAHTIRLDRMQWAEAATLLAELSRHSPVLAAASEAERRALYEESAGNPLILCWVAGQLGRGTGECRTISGAISRLRYAPSGDEALEFVFGDLADTFTVDEMRLLAALTYFAHPVAVEHLAELADVGEMRARDVLESLSERSLVTGDTELRHFLLPPLVADFLRRKNPAVVRERGDHLARSTYALAVDKGYHHYHRFRELERHWPKVMAGLPELDYDKLQKVCDALTVFLDFTGRWDESLALERRAEDAAGKRGDRWRAGWRAVQQAYVMFRRGDPEGVRTATERARRHWAAYEHKPYEAGILSRRRGMELQLRGDLAGALAAYRQAHGHWLALNPENDDIARALNDIGFIEQQLGEHAPAEEHHREALRIALNMDFAERIAQSTGHLADVALIHQDWVNAEELARKAAALAHRMEYRELAAANYRRIARALAGQGKPARALAFARDAVAAFEQLRSRELPEARQTLEACERAAREAAGAPVDEQGWLREGDDDAEPDGDDLYARALALQEEGRHGEAEEKFLGALKGVRDAGTEARIRNSLGWTLQRQRRWDDAEEAYRAAAGIARRIGDAGEEWASRENLARLAEERERAAALAVAPPPPPGAAEPFEDAVRALERQGAGAAGETGGVLFYGSSSIEYWPALESDFPGLPVLQRGIGGATLQDCVRLYPRLVRPCRPRVVVLYAGDNDLAEGRTPGQIAGALAAFLDLLSRDGSGAQVGFISIKPSPVRRAQDDIEETNRVIAEFAATRPELSFLDVYPAMLGPDGSPDHSLFLDDGLHLSPAGYDAWRRVVRPWVEAACVGQGAQGWRP